jgi:nucleotide-binding universal stress UspA family protein
MITRILVAYDGSEPAGKAYACAVDLAQKYGASLTALAVSRPPDVAEEVETRAILENSLKHYRHLLAALQKKAAAQGIAIKLEVIVGHPAEQIIAYAERHGIDLIVIGQHGKSLFERWRLGSVSQRVLQYAHCPVLVVR